MEPTDLELRPADAEDVRGVRRLVRDAYGLYVQRIGREPAPMTADYEALVAAREVTVAVEDGTIVGVLVLREQPGSLLVENVAVAPAAQGRGIGRALLAHAEIHARALGLRRIALYTNAKMTENLSFYPSLGYVEVDRHVEHGFERVFFEKALRP